ncbi:MAG: hypothetical protein VXW24_01375, partial [Bacteroidota bacterium]|nr:hypothetical protein [Bacteroidota bacterium]
SRYPKHFLWLIFCTLCFSTSYGQRSESLFTGYVSGGVAVGQISGDLMAGFRKLGTDVFVGTELHWTENFHNSVELGYAMRGSQSNYTLDASAFRKFTMDYAQANILFNYFDERVTMFHLGVGYSQLVRSSYKAGINKTEINANQNVFNGQDWSIIAGITFLLKPKHGLTFRTQYSLSNAFPDGPYFNYYGNLAPVGTSNGNFAAGQSRARKSGLYHQAISLRYTYRFLK